MWAAMDSNCALNVLVGYVQLVNSTRAVLSAGGTPFKTKALVTPTRESSTTP